MKRDELIEVCRTYPKATEDFPFDQSTLAFRVGGKIFALFDLNAAPPSVNLKCEPELSSDLRHTHAAIKPGYHMNKEHWNTVELDDSLPPELIRELADRSYALVEGSLTAAARAAAGLPPRKRGGD